MIINENDVLVHIITESKKKKRFTQEEDNIIINGVKSFGEDWKKISSLLQDRTEKQCKIRFHTYLKPGINSQPMTLEEAKLLIDLYKLLGPKWSAISKHFKGRSGNMLKNFFNCHVIKRPRKSKNAKKQHNKEPENITNENIEISADEFSIGLDLENLQTDDFLFYDTLDLNTNDMFWD